MSIKKTSVSLEDIDIQTVADHARRFGLNFSAALRMIIREKRERDEARFVVTDKGKQALEEHK